MHRISIIVLWALLVTILLPILFEVNKDRNTITQELVETKELVEKYELQLHSSLVSLTKEDLAEDLKKYPHLSTRAREQILVAILEAAEEFQVSPIVLYGILQTESSFQSWVKHNETTILKNNVSIKVRAIGLGGILWEWHGEDLKANGIAETKADLYDPVVNIRGTAYIFSRMKDMPMKNGAKSARESALLRYFGGNYQDYITRVYNNIGTIAVQKQLKD
jgi:soluble lytic murein transglycosylase-like protein